MQNLGSKKDWLNIRQGTIIFGNQVKDKFYFVLRVESVTSFPDGIEILSKDFVTVRLVTVVDLRSYMQQK